MEFTNNTNIINPMNTINPMNLLDHLDIINYREIILYNESTKIEQVEEYAGLENLEHQENLEEHKDQENLEDGEDLEQHPMSDEEINEILQYYLEQEEKQKEIDMIMDAEHQYDITHCRNCHCEITPNIIVCSEACQKEYNQSFYEFPFGRW